MKYRAYQCHYWRILQQVPGGPTPGKQILPCPTFVCYYCNKSACVTVDTSCGLGARRSISPCKFSGLLRPHVFVYWEGKGYEAREQQAKQATECTCCKEALKSEEERYPCLQEDCSTVRCGKCFKECNSDSHPKERSVDVWCDAVSGSKQSECYHKQFEKMGLKERFKRVKDDLRLYRANGQPVYSSEEEVGTDSATSLESVESEEAWDDPEENQIEEGPVDQWGNLSDLPEGVDVDADDEGSVAATNEEIAD